MASLHTVTLRDGEIAEYSNALLRRENLAKLIGLVIAEWSTAESILAVTFGVLLQVDLTISAPILDAVRNINAKRNQVVNVARAKIKDAALLKRVEAHLSGLADAGDQRSKVAHGRWATCEAHPDVLLWHANTMNVGGATWTVYDEAAFVDLINRIVHFRNALQLTIPEIEQQVRRAVEDPLDALGQLPPIEGKAN